ncbi:hypothetical protein [Companilactobacillus zhachilii]|uniref:hypothetical protein n=1 Tax=Companilactobacillus zhachilii TaxID=2304606 RepID=UPI003B8A766D
MALNESVKNKLSAIYGYFNEVVHDEKIVKQLVRAKSEVEVKQVLGGERVAND